MPNIELLSPVGDFDCLKAAVQNGADAVYLGVSEFNARYSAKNFTLETLQEAINYAKIRNVKVHLTLNTLVKDEELEYVLNIARTAYNYGVDSIIVQDFGLANLIMKYLPDLPVHASTQMTIHNLEGAKYLKNLGFSRVVLSRELSISEISGESSPVNAFSKKTWASFIVLMSLSYGRMLKSRLSTRFRRFSDSEITDSLPLEAGTAKYL